MPLGAFTRHFYQAYFKGGRVCFGPSCEQPKEKDGISAVQQLITFEPWGELFERVDCWVFAEDVVRMLIMQRSSELFSSIVFSSVRMSKTKLGSQVARFQDVKIDTWTAL